MRRVLAGGLGLIVSIGVALWWVSSDRPGESVAAEPASRQRTTVECERSSKLAEPTFQSRELLTQTEQGAEIQCIVLAADGDPIAGVQLYLVQPPDPDERELAAVDLERCTLLFEGTSDSEGRARIPAALERHVFVHAQASDGRTARAWVEHPEVTLRLAPLQKPVLQGYVAFGDGSPVSDFTIVCFEFDDHTSSELAHAEFHASDGYFRLVLPERDYERRRVRLLARGDPSHVPASLELGAAELSESVVRRLTLIEKRGGPRGHLFDPDGAPIVGGVLHCSGADGTGQLSTTSDAQGAFAFEATELFEPAFVSAQSAAFAPLLVDLASVPRAQHTELVLQLQTGALVRGRVLAASRLPPGTRVRAWIGSGAPASLGPLGPWQVESWVGADGSFRLENVPLGYVDLAVALPPSDLDGSDILCAVRRVHVIQREESVELELARGRQLAACAEIAAMPGALLFVQAVDGLDPSIVLGEVVSRNGRCFTLAHLPARALRLHLWVNASTRAELDVDAGETDVDLGLVKLETSSLKHTPTRR